MSVSIVLMLSFFFYSEFQRALDQRILLQLTSVKRLKRVQIEDYLNRKWVSFQQKQDLYVESFDSSGVYNKATFKEMLVERQIIPGIYDITPHLRTADLSLLFLDTLNNDLLKIAWLSPEGIKNILMERTGLGQSGETYLVGTDYRMRSESRFFPDSLPYNIIARTEGAVKALNGINGRSIIDDYREVPVYSAFHSLTVKGLQLAILTELDVDEASMPIQSMNKKLIAIALAVITSGVLASIFIALFLSRPVKLMQGQLRQIAIGSQSIEIPKHSRVSEINDTFLTLQKLKDAIGELVNFSVEIGKMNLNASFEPRSDFDALGHSLLLMRNKLVEFNQKAKESDLQIRRSLIKGQEGERQRLAKELHDGLGPFLTTLKLKIQSSEIELPLKSEIKNMLDDTIIEVRRMTQNLMPQSLVDFGVGDAIAQLVVSIQNSTSINIDYERDLDTGKVPDEIGKTIYRITQELLNNTLKHAKASQIRLSVSIFENLISLYYEDNGKGFEKDKITKGLGLHSIQDRVGAFNGFLLINPSKEGVHVEVEIRF
ncbi:MAG: hypothetical protein JXR03_03665 [Cyclobacteriaceae bacterium]